MNHIDESLEFSESNNHNSPYYLGKEEQESVECPVCLSAKSYWNGEDYLPCSTCNATGYVAQDFELNEELFNNEEE